MTQKYTRTQIQILLASAISSIVSTVITNPIQVAKLNKQFFPLSCPSYPHQTYIDMFRCKCSKFSFQGSIKSMRLAIPQVLLSNIAFMQIYQQTRQTLINKFQIGNIKSTLLASFLGRFIVSSLNIPVQSLRIRLSNQIIDKKINIHGYKVTLIRDLIYSGLFWSMFQTYRNFMADGQYRQKLQKDKSFNFTNFAHNLAPGFVFGAIVSTLTTPLDTLKTRIQSKGIKRYKILSGISDIYKKQGMMGLFAGVEWRVLKSSVHISLYLLIYEWYMGQILVQDSKVMQGQI